MGIDTIPQWLKKALMRSFKNSTSQDDWFPVWDEAANRWLVERLPITTDRQEFVVTAAFRVYFDWRLGGGTFRVSV